MNDQEARDHIAEQIKQYGPPASISDALQKKEWDKQFGQPHVIVDMEAVLGSLRPTPARTTTAGQEMYHHIARHVYCLLCIEEMEHRGIETYRLHVRWEDDPLKNIACLIHMMCFHCDFEQYVGVDKDPRIPQAQEASQSSFDFTNQTWKSNKLVNFPSGAAQSWDTTTASEPFAGGNLTTIASSGWSWPWTSK